MNRVLRKALDSIHSPMAIRAFGTLSFLESALIPIPVESLYLPLLAARRDRIWFLALLGTITSVAGGIVGYIIGIALFESVGKWILSMYQAVEKFEDFRFEMAQSPQRGGMLVLLGAITPIPYKVICIAAGAIGYFFPLFILLAAIGRATRYYAFALAFYLFGPAIHSFMETRPRVMSGIVVGVLVLGFVVLAFVW